MGGLTGYEKRARSNATCTMYIGRGIVGKIILLVWRHDVRGSSSLKGC